MIDLWSLDVEGAELEVLRTVDFRRLVVKAIVVETDCHNRIQSAKIIDLIMNAGFQLVHSQECRNSFFVNKKFLPFLRSFNSSAAHDH